MLDLISEKHEHNDVKYSRSFFTNWLLDIEKIYLESGSSYIVEAFQAVMY